MAKLKAFFYDHNTAMSKWTLSGVPARVIRQERKGIQIGKEVELYLQMTWESDRTDTQSYSNSRAIKSAVSGYKSDTQQSVVLLCNGKK